VRTYTVEQELSKLGYNVILSNTGNDTGLKIRNMNALLKKKVDSIILVGSVFKDESLDRQITAIADKLPIIMVNGFVDSENVYSVISDDRAGMLKAVDYLAARGRKSIRYFKDVDTYSARAKVEGFKAGLESNSLNPLNCTVINVGKGVNGGIDGVEQLIRDGMEYDALLCGDDITAAGALRCLKKHGIKVPADVSVIGFNNSVLAQCCDPVLTSVDSRMEDMGRTAVEVLIRVLEGEEVNRKTVLTPGLAVGESS
jgi:DNA-binding LacI/PurR family transcriptional regulator